MRCAIYARFSSDLQKETSIEDQVRNCEQRAKREGWTIVQRYEDKAISGSTDELGRPGLKRLLEDAEAKRFDILLVDDLSRLSRDTLKAEEVRRLLVYSDVRLIGVNDGTDTGLEDHELMFGIHSAINQSYLRKLAKHVHRGLTGRVLNGFSAGGRVYGYKRVPVYDPIKTDLDGHPVVIGAQREINEEQATWVRKIYGWYAEGKSARWIAAHLNELGLPSPGATYHRTKRRSPLYGSWGDMTVESILRNVLYIGQVTWNRRRWIRVPKTNQKQQRLRPEEQWITKTVKELQIISPALWDKVQARREEGRHAPHPPGAAPSGRTPKFLFSSLLRCSECGSSYIIATRYQDYACGGHLYRGASQCANQLRVAKAVVEAKLLASIQQELLSEEAEAFLLKEVRRLMAERAQRRRPEAATTQKQLIAVEKTIANIMTAIKAGILTPTTKAELEKAEAERERLLRGPRAAEQADEKVVAMIPNLRERYRALVKNLACLPMSRVAEARTQLRKILGGDITLQPTPDGRLQALVPTGGILKLAVGADSPRVNPQKSVG